MFFAKFTESTIVEKWIIKELDADNKCLHGNKSVTENLNTIFCHKLATFLIKRIFWNDVFFY